MHQVSTYSSGLRPIYLFYAYFSIFGPEANDQIRDCFKTEINNMTFWWNYYNNIFTKIFLYHKKTVVCITVDLVIFVFLNFTETGTGPCGRFL